ncbi:MAG: nickel-responsive transcriptional regulator NikR [Candidatus Altiarchaeota archaeon]|nr:nickel-responsive transcriptional regulator NikR [Candidatus Altiarchaeota archaeon]
MISFSLGEKLRKGFDQKIREKGYCGRSEALRELVRDYVSAEEWEHGIGKRSIAVVSIIYGKRSSKDIVSDIQHEYGSLFRTTLHTHLDDGNCLEVLIASGNGRRIKELIKRIRTVRGVKQVKYVTSVSGI